MHTSEDPISQLREAARHTVASSVTVDVPIEMLSTIVGAGTDPSRWSPFIVASIPGSDRIAVVAPRKPSGTVRLTGSQSRPSTGPNLVVEATRGHRGRCLRLVHKIQFSRVGSFRTAVHLTTTISGAAAMLIRRRRITEWHAREATELTDRVRQKCAAGIARSRSPTLDPEVTDAGLHTRCLTASTTRKGANL